MAATLNEKEEDLLAQAYNVILDETVPSQERELVLAFKRDVEKGRDFAISSYHLERALQRLAVEYLNDRTSFSVPVRGFYKSLNTYLEKGLRNIEIGKGLIVLGGIL